MQVSSLWVWKRQLLFIRLKGPEIGITSIQSGRREVTREMNRCRNILKPITKSASKF